MGINKEKLALDIMFWLKTMDLNTDTRIYYSGKALDGTTGEIENIDPASIIDESYVSKIMNITFEGGLNYLVNGMCSFDGNYSSMIQEFDSIFTSHKVYYELGNSWNLGVYEL